MSVARAREHGVEEDRRRAGAKRRAPTSWSIRTGAVGAGVSALGGCRPSNVARSAATTCSSPAAFVDAARGGSEPGQARFLVDDDGTMLVGHEGSDSFRC